MSTENEALTLGGIYFLMYKNEGFENINVLLPQYSTEIISCHSSIWNF